MVGPPKNHPFPLLLSDVLNVQNPSAVVAVGEEPGAVSVQLLD